ncbi:HAD hydrolase family protein, partial [Streptomyces sp. NPDC002130]|uniref:HAD family hydrolase n=1 Tax=Streptomyces sp. NPDC002130 TaxID=3155568 RepID=UPI00331F1FA3
LIELSAPGITKASGLVAAAERFGFDLSGLVAFGDMPNDIPMLGLARLGVAMGNAHPEAKAAADEVTDANSENGVAKVLERWCVEPTSARGRVLRECQPTGALLAISWAKVSL